MGWRKHVRDLMHASFILAEAIETEPSERMQLWAAQYALENVEGTAFFKGVQHPKFSKEEQDQVVHLVRRVWIKRQKRREAEAGANDGAKPNKPGGKL